MQDTTAGNKNAGNVMRKNTPKDPNTPNANADHDTIARVCLKMRMVTRLQLTSTDSIELEKV